MKTDPSVSYDPKEKKKKASLLFAINWNWLKCAGFFQTVIHKTLWQSSTIVSTDCKWTVYCYLIPKKKIFAIKDIA